MGAEDSPYRFLSFAFSKPLMSDRPRPFPTTSRTLLAALHSEDQRTRETSLARFCAAYYPAIYGYARMLGLREADAKDRAQDFFVEVVQDDLLAKFDAQRGTHLSSWLMTCFKNLESNHRTAQTSQKRGGGSEFVSLDSEHAENSYRSAHLAQLPMEPTFDLMLAREIWLAAKKALLKRHAATKDEQFVAELLPLVLLERWPQPPMPTQEEMALRHGTTPTRLKAFFNRTLKTRARAHFDREASGACPGISSQDIDHLWALLCRYGED